MMVINNKFDEMLCVADSTIYNNNNNMNKMALACSVVFLLFSMFPFVIGGISFHFSLLSSVILAALFCLLVSRAYVLCYSQHFVAHVPKNERKL